MLPQPARAQSGVNSGSTFEVKSAMEVKPILNEIAAKPGETITKEITVSSLAQIPLPIKAYSRAFIATDDYGGSDYPDDKKPNSVQSWFNLEEPDFILQPKTTKIVKVNITIPQDARPGGHYATLFFESLIPKEVLSDTSLYLASRIGALFFFVVGGEIKESGKVVEFKTLSFWRHEDITFNLNFQNEGNVHVRPQSQITITDWRGNVVDTLEDRGNTTLPEKNRIWNIVWTKKPWIGKFTAKLETKLDQDAPVQVREARFYVFPSTEFGIFLAAAFLILFIVRGRKRLIKAGRSLINLKELTEKDKYKL